MFKRRYKVNHDKEVDYGNDVNYEKVKNLANRFNYSQERSLEAEFDKWMEQKEVKRGKFPNKRQKVDRINLGI